MIDMEYIRGFYPPYSTGATAERAIVNETVCIVDAAERTGFL